MQLQRGYFMFRQRNNYKAAAKVFTQWALPTEQLCLLFAEMFPKRYVDDLMNMFPELAQSSKLAHTGSSLSSAKSTPMKQGGGAKDIGAEFISQVDLQPARDEAAQQMYVFAGG